ncbi:MAG: sigma-54-dependent Fis family transcriptional regulator [Planctomycetes bacterium]|nr:sigma-54-dependent Fis family transcriptional regulator [Planctomycetota bacterium]
MSEERELRWLRRVRQFVDRLGGESDQARLFPEVLDAAIELAEAERGFLVLVNSATKPPRLSIVAARGFAQETLSGQRSDISQTVVERVLVREGEGLVTTHEGDADVLDVSSVVQRKVRAIACVPMRLRGEIHGVLYLDHRLRSDCFHVDDLPYLRLFADQAALALETAALRGGEGGALQGRQDELASALALVEEATPDSERQRLRYGTLIGASPPMARLYEFLERGARTRAPALISGESGTGKEHVARELHTRGLEPNAPFVSVNCAALDSANAVSELFGHVAGAYTGAAGARVGLFREAGHGTLLLDEIGDLSPDLQATLLRAVQEQEVRPLGGDQAHPFSCRIVATTHRNLRELVSDGRFREDLFYRLDVIRLEVPPLRERLEDVPLLIEHFARREEATLRLTPRALRLLMSYSWPGNVRELENEVRRLGTLRAREISAKQLSEEIRTSQGLTSAAPETALAGKTLAEVERELVKAALAACQGNKAQAARQLGVPRTSLYTLLKRHGLE